MTLLSHLPLMHLLDSIGWTLIQSLWQVSVIAVILHLLFSVIPMPASAKFRLAFAAMLASVCWMVYTFLSIYQMETIIFYGSRTSAPALSSAEVLHPTVWNVDLLLTALRSYAPWISAAWIAGLLLGLLKYGLAFAGVRRLRHRNVHDAPALWQSRLEALREQFGIRTRVQLKVSALVRSPVTIGFFRPLILVPASFFLHLSPEQAESVLLHELAHVKRADYLLNVIQLACRLLLFFHPGMWFMQRCLEIEREHACDDFALLQTGNVAIYIKALTSLQLHVHTKNQLTMNLTSPKNDLLSRIKRMLNNHNRTTPSLSALYLPVLMLTIGLLLSGFIVLQTPEQTSAEVEALVVDTVPSRQELQEKQKEMEAQLREKERQLQEQAIEMERMARDLARESTEKQRALAHEEKEMLREQLQKLEELRHKEAALLREQQEHVSQQVHEAVRKQKELIAKMQQKAQEQNRTDSEQHKREMKEMEDSLRELKESSYRQQTEQAIELRKRMEQMQENERRMIDELQEKVEQLQREEQLQRDERQTKQRELRDEQRQLRKKLRRQEGRRDRDRNLGWHQGDTLPDFAVWDADRFHELLAEDLKLEMATEGFEDLQRRLDTMRNLHSDFMPPIDLEQDIYAQLPDLSRELAFTERWNDISVDLPRVFEGQMDGWQDLSGSLEDHDFELGLRPEARHRMQQMTNELLDAIREQGFDVRDREVHLHLDPSELTIDGIPVEGVQKAILEEILRHHGHELPTKMELWLDERRRGWRNE